ncbi:MAG TPA: hypothetical protein VK878_10750 [Candidatus Deferrimicrobiaceae bacterium]|nr:hypothetical protein [Candidatus Deferrimicrobiaceae bacterium]
MENAEVIGRHGPQAVIKRDKKLGADKITVRLQGIDAPSYNSMTRNEVRQALADYATAAQDGRGMWRGKHVKAALAPFVATRRYRKGPTSFTPFSDKGPVNFPKFFRRQADHHVRRAVGVDATPASFLAYLASKSDDVAGHRDLLELPGTDHRSGLLGGRRQAGPGEHEDADHQVVRGGGLRRAAGTDPRSRCVS